MKKYSDNLRGLKKTSEGYYDKESHLLFTKDKDGLKIIISEYDKELFNNQKKRLLALEKKYNVSLKSELNDLKDAFDEYKEYVKRFNNRDVKWSSTVESRYKTFEKATMKHEKIFGNINMSKETKKQFSVYVENKKKVMILRMSGHKGVFDNNVNSMFDSYLQTFSDKLGVSKDEVKGLLFPTGLEETSSYDEMIEVLDGAYYNMQDLIEEKVNEGVITEYDAISLENLMDAGLEELF